MNDYDKIATAIRYIRKNIAAQPSLEDISSQVHLSPYHFQRLFSRWAGVTPKRFLQVLTLQNAKALIKQNHLPLLEISDSLGLSSGSRLYEHFVHLEAVTPSEYKQSGLNLVIHYGCYSGPFGNTFIALTPRGICKLSFIENNDLDEQLISLKYKWPQAKFIEDNNQAAKAIEDIFSKPKKISAPLSVLVQGTNFQVKVWQALLTLNSGDLTSYGEIAKAIGKPKAARAVGTAIGANPIAFVIPCHRVIQKSGELGGYRWGEVRKHAMLMREQLITPV